MPVFCLTAIRLKAGVSLDQRSGWDPNPTKSATIITHPPLFTSHTMAELSTEPETRHKESGDQQMSYMSSRCPRSSFTTLQFSLFLEGEVSLEPLTRLPTTPTEEGSSEFSLQMWTTVSNNVVEKGIAHIFHPCKLLVLTIACRGKEFTYTDKNQLRCNYNLLINSPFGEKRTTLTALVCLERDAMNTILNLSPSFSLEIFQIWSVCKSTLVSWPTIDLLWHHCQLLQWLISNKKLLCESPHWVEAAYCAKLSLEL